MTKPAEKKLSPILAEILTDGISVQVWVRNTNYPDAAPVMVATIDATLAAEPGFQPIVVGLAEQIAGHLHQRYVGGEVAGFVFHAPTNQQKAH